ncbi:hypothetical protein QYF36_002154 [Acer negundo]|nr:hypothetical protein QYF36_002154 [Acer negundo]
MGVNLMGVRNQARAPTIPEKNEESAEGDRVTLGEGEIDMVKHGSGHSSDPLSQIGDMNAINELMARDSNIRDNQWRAILGNLSSKRKLGDISMSSNVQEPRRKFHRIGSKKIDCTSDILRDIGVENCQDSKDLCSGDMGVFIESKEATYSVFSDLGGRNIEEEETQKDSGMSVSSKKEFQQKFGTSANRSLLDHRPQ